MNRYPNSVLSISGIAYDNEDVNNNNILSDKRAKSCFQYLTKRGISEDILFGLLIEVSIKNLISKIPIF